MKYFALLLLAAVWPAQAFQAQSGAWDWTHQITWPDDRKGYTDKERICIAPAESADYPRAQMQAIEADGCTVSQFKQTGDTASFRAVCPDMRFNIRYEKQSATAIRLTQNMHTAKGKTYQADGIMTYIPSASCTQP